MIHIIAKLWINTIRKKNILFFILLLISLGWFIYRFNLTLEHKEFGDETEKFIAAAVDPYPVFIS